MKDENQERKKKELWLNQEVERYVE